MINTVIIMKKETGWFRKDKSVPSGMDFFCAKLSANNEGEEEHESVQKIHECTCNGRKNCACNHISAYSGADSVKCFFP